MLEGLFVLFGFSALAIFLFCLHEEHGPGADEN